MEVRSVTNGQWFNQPCLCDETSIEIPKDGSGNSQVSERGTFGESNGPGEGIRALCPFPTPGPIQAFHRAVSELQPFVTNQGFHKENIPLSSVSYLSR